jgi:hypothetical protein
MTTTTGLRVRRLATALIDLMEAGGVNGRNLHPSKDVMLRAGEDHVVPLNAVVFEPGGVLRLDGTNITERPVLSAGYLREAVIRGDQDAEVLLNVGGIVVQLSRISWTSWGGAFVVFLTGQLEDA